MSSLCFTHLEDPSTGVRCVAIFETGRFHDPHVVIRRADFRAAMRFLRPLGEGLAEVRKERGLTQKVLAEEVGVSRTYLSEIERGNASNLTLRAALRISEVLDASVADLFPRYFPESQ